MIGGGPRRGEGAVAEGGRGGEGWREDFRGAELGIGCNGRVDGELSLGQKVLEVAQDAATERVLRIDPLHAPQIAADLSRALPEPHDAIVQEGPGVPVGRVRIYKS